MEHILVLDDDREICQLVSSYLEKNGFCVKSVTDGKKFASTLENWHVDLVILDLLLPDDDGLVICRNLRAKSAMPVLILSAKGEEMDRIIGLEMGADDYLPKPFNPRELLARVKSILRRSRQAKHVEMVDPEMAYRFAGWILDSLSRQIISPDGEVTTLSGAEHALLNIFIRHPNRVLSRENLLQLSHIPGKQTEAYDRSIDMQVSRLRRRLMDDSKKPALIKTIRSAGYIFCATVDRVSRFAQTAWRPTEGLS